MRQTKRDERELHERIQSGISQFDAISQGSFHQPGYPKPTPYLTPPLNEYQAWMRKGTKSKVMYHYTAKFSVKIVERYVILYGLLEKCVKDVNFFSYDRVVNVPLEPLANHKGRANCVFFFSNEMLELILYHTLDLPEQLFLGAKFYKSSYKSKCSVYIWLNMWNLYSVCL